MKRDNVRITVSIAIERGPSYAEQCYVAKEIKTVGSYESVDQIDTQVERQLIEVAKGIAEGLDIMREEETKDDSK